MVTVIARFFFKRKDTEMRNPGQAAGIVEIAGM